MRTINAFWSISKMLATTVLLLVVFGNVKPPNKPDSPDHKFTLQRTKLLAEIQSDAALLTPHTGRTAFHSTTLEALQAVPRHLFVDEKLRDFAYENRPLPIGFGQTISQPLIVALMTDLLDLQAHMRVLEIGTGSGYQAAVLAQIVKEIYSIEIVKELAQKSTVLLQSLNYHNVHVELGDGYYGLENKAPFDAIIVTAAANHVPSKLLDQLRVGGKMIIPIGPPFAVQYLYLIEKSVKGIRQRQILAVEFVPFVREIDDKKQKSGK